MYLPCKKKSKYNASTYLKNINNINYGISSSNNLNKKNDTPRGTNMNKEVVVNQNLTPITYPFDSPMDNNTDDKKPKKRKRKNRPNLM